MNKMINFIEMIKEESLLTRFIKFMFGYNSLNDYNYIFRIVSNDDEIIIDIYDNVSINRFNRYIFKFGICDYIVNDIKEDFIFVKYISILNIKDSNNNLYKFAYLFSLDDNEMLEYARSFLYVEFVNILKKIIK